MWSFERIHVERCSKYSSVKMGLSNRGPGSLGQVCELFFWEKFLQFDASVCAPRKVSAAFLVHCLDRLVSACGSLASLFLVVSAVLRCCRSC